MKRDALKVFVCPACKGPLVLGGERWEGAEAVEGMLTCGTCAAAYPIVRGVPRFVRADAYAASFGRQWHWFRTIQIDAITGGHASAQSFAGTTGWTAADLEGHLVLDAGVGAGRYADCASRAGAQVYGVDLTVAVDAAYQNVGRRPNVHLAQADIFALPFRDGTFDRAYSIGVLHHTPDTAAAFARVAATVRPGGDLAVYVYHRYGLYYRGSDVLRVVTTRLPPTLMLGLTTVAIPLHFVYAIPGIGAILRLAMPISPLRNWRARWLDTFDWYTPKYQWKHLYPEVFRWFRDNGFHDVQIFDDPIRMRGMKAVEVGTDEPELLNRLVAS
jgi:SAM-dependent methyltransferase